MLEQPTYNETSNNLEVVVNEDLVWRQVKQNPDAWVLVRVWRFEHNGQRYPMESGWLAYIGQGEDGVWSWHSELKAFGWEPTLEDAQKVCRDYVEMRGSGGTIQKRAGRAERPFIQLIQI